MTRNNDDEYIEIFEAPRNFKKARYILGRFTIQGIIALVASIVLSIFLMILYITFSSSPNIFVVLALLLPIIIVTILLAPMRTYLNVLSKLRSKTHYIFKQKNYKWEGFHHNVVLNEEEQYDLNMNHMDKMSMLTKEVKL